MKHPIHPAIVHFPIACWTLATFGDIASIWLGSQIWWWSGVNLWVGNVTAIIAMVIGVIDLLKIADQQQTLKIAGKHIQFILLAWMFYAASLFMRVDHFTLQAPTLIEISLSCFGFLILLIGAWFGAHLVYKYRVGMFIS